MEDENIDYLIEAGKRDISDPCELNRLHEIATRHIEKHQRSCKSASVSIFLYNKFKFYEFEGKKSCQEYLDSLGYSKGAISHMLRYGEFIVMMGFSENQIPPEYLVRPILTNYNKENWREIYRNACEDYRMHKELQRIGDIPVNDDDEDDDDEDDDDGDIKTNVVKSVKKDSPTESNPISKSRTVSEKNTTPMKAKIPLGSRVTMVMMTMVTTMMTSPCLTIFLGKKKSKMHYFFSRWTMKITSI